MMTLFWWLVFYLQTVNSLPPRNMKVTGGGSEDAGFASCVIYSFPHLFWGLRSVAVLFLLFQLFRQSRGTGSGGCRAMAPLSMSRYLGRGFRRACVSSVHSSRVVISYTHFNPTFVPSISSFDQFSIGCLQTCRFFLSLVLCKLFKALDFPTSLMGNSVIDPVWKCF